MHPPSTRNQNGGFNVGSWDQQPINQPERLKQVSTYAVRFLIQPYGRGFGYLVSDEMMGVSDDPTQLNFRFFKH